MDRMPWWEYRWNCFLLNLKIVQILFVVDVAAATWCVTAELVNEWEEEAEGLLLLLSMLLLLLMTLLVYHDDLLQGPLSHAFYQNVFYRVVVVAVAVVAVVIVTPPPPDQSVIMVVPYISSTSFFHKRLCDGRKLSSWLSWLRLSFIVASCIENHLVTMVVGFVYSVGRREFLYKDRIDFSSSVGGFVLHENYSDD